jgi:hypothetical protein
MYILKHTPKFFFKSLSAYSSTSIVRFIFEQQVKYFSIYLPKIPPPELNHNPVMYNSS